MAKRFRIFNINQQTLVADCHTTQQVYDFLLTFKDLYAQLFVDCNVDNIEVAAEDFMNAAEYYIKHEGGLPNDLKFADLDDGNTGMKMETY